LKEKKKKRSKDKQEQKHYYLETFSHVDVDKFLLIYTACLELGIWVDGLVSTKKSTMESVCPFFSKKPTPRFMSVKFYCQLISGKKRKNGAVILS
jgi:hypothetical protein